MGWRILRVERSSTHLVLHVPEAAGSKVRLHCRLGGERGSGTSKCGTHCSTTSQAESRTPALEERIRERAAS